MMIEFTDVAEGQLILRRPVAPGSNITFAGTDIGQDARGERGTRHGQAGVRRKARQGVGPVLPRVDRRIQEDIEDEFVRSGD